MLISAYGLFWKEEDVFWGRGSVAGSLLGVPANNVTHYPINFREQAGVYVLYANFQIVYVGQAGVGNQKLFNRLKQHTRDALAERWTQFSWFGIRRVLTNGMLSAERDAKHSDLKNILNHIEGILIYAAEPRLNRQGGKFGEKTIQYLQHRDTDRLGLTQSKMIREILHSQKDSLARLENIEAQNVSKS